MPSSNALLENAGSCIQLWTAHPAILFCIPGLNTDNIIYSRANPSTMPYCPACNNSVVWIPAYGQYWCNACQRYYATPRNEVDSFLVGIGNEFSPPQPRCGRCGVNLQFVPQYQRWYCPRCQQYMWVLTPTPANRPSSPNHNYYIHTILLTGHTS